MSFVKIRSLHIGDKGFNIKVKILDKESDRVVTIKKTQMQNRVANFRVGDETGTITLTVWGADIDSIPIGNTIKIEKAYVRDFNNKLYLNIGQYSKWSTIQEELEVLDIFTTNKPQKKITKVCNLIYKKKGINLEKVKVIEINNIRSVKVKKDGSSHEVADALIGDETGCIKCSLWDEDIRQVEENMILKIHNAYISEYKGIPQLNISKFSKYEVLPPEDLYVDDKNNLSEVEIN
ncbi:MAG: hypothetical protein ACTSRG_16870 [Candidatus Helarchaeota archaeon]